MLSKPYLGTKTQLDQVDILKGNQYYTTDTQQIFVDTENGRIPFSTTFDFFEVVLEVANWQNVENSTFCTYEYQNPKIKCGNGNFPPAIYCVDDNKTEYGYITSAVATPGTGIIFTCYQKPTANINLIIKDLK